MIDFNVKVGRPLYYLDEYGNIKCTKIMYKWYEDFSYGTKILPTSDIVFIYPKDYYKYYTNVTQIPYNGYIRRYR